MAPADRVLMIAYHFPPLAGSSGIQRTLRFVQQLPDCGWEPIVLGASRHAFERVSPDLAREVPPKLVVERALALDTARHLAVRGRYAGALAVPDRWVSWWPHAIVKGLAMIRRYRPAVLWSTYPIATAHMIGHTLSRLSGVPWVADFRDPMAQDDYPTEPAVRRSFERIERAALARAHTAVFTTRGAADVYRNRYPQHAGKVAVIENGFDEESFTGLASAPVRQEGPFTLLHSGIVYPSERDPRALFTALARLHRAGRITPAQLRIRLRAAVHDGLLQTMAAEAGVADYIELAPPLPYREALAEMLDSDALLVLQAANCNQQIPAKVYEYLRARRPVLGLTDPAGDTGELLARNGVQWIAPLDDAEAIAAALPAFVDAARAGQVSVPTAEQVATHSRRARTAALAGVLATAAA
ncbi:MAG: glycosyltransferase [Rhodocyclaceae bacterium]